MWAMSAEMALHVLAYNVTQALPPLFPTRIRVKPASNTVASSLRCASFSFGVCPGAPGVEAQNPIAHGLCIGGVDGGAWKTIPGPRMESGRVVSSARYHCL